MVAITWRTIANETDIGRAYNNAIFLLYLPRRSSIYLPGVGRGSFETYMYVLSILFRI